MPADIRADAVLAFWFEDGLQRGWPSRSLSALWFGGGEVLDDDIRRRFGPLVDEALAGGLIEWQLAPLQRLALVVLLDQFSRNVYRGQAKAFAGDARAQSLATDALATGQDTPLPLAGRVFLGMPLMHAESLELQDRCIGFFETLVACAPPERADDLQAHLQAACEHREIIAAFGRFPHRNAVLGRTTSADEHAYLATGKRFGQ